MVLLVLAVSATSQELPHWAFLGHTCSTTWPSEALTNANSNSCPLQNQRVHSVTQLSTIVFVIGFVLRIV